MSTLVPEPGGGMQAAASPVSTAPDGVTPAPPQRRGFAASFVIAWFGLNLALGTIMIASIPKALAAFDEADKTTNLSIVTAIGGVVVMIITPLFGRFSDRSMSAYGMRKPWMLGGVFVGMVGITVLAFGEGLWLTVLAYSVVHIGFGATNMAVHALLADAVPTRRRALISGLASASGGLALIVGTVIIAVLNTSPQWTWFMVPGVIGSLCCLLLWARYADMVRTVPPGPLTARDLLETYWLNPSKYRDFAWAFAVRLLITMSITTIATYLYYILTDHLGVSEDEASNAEAITLAMYTVVGMGTAVLFGWLSDRWGRRKPVLWVSCTLSVVGLTLAITAPDLTTFYIAMVVVGAAQGSFVSVDVALMTEVLPSFADAGKDLGIVSLSYQLPMVLVPILAVPLLATGGGGPNYPALFAAAIVYGIVGAAAVFPIRSVR